MLITAFFQDADNNDVNLEDIAIIDVPEDIVNNIEVIQRQFFSWLFDETNNHEYWVTINGINLCSYDVDAFIKWLNIYVLKEKKAILVQRYVDKIDKRLPIIYF